MLKDEIRFVSAQPDELHFIWQTDVYLENFRALGIPPENCVALFGIQPEAEPSFELHRLRIRHADADVRFLTDTRDDDGRGYAPTIQPHLILKLLDDEPDWEGRLTFFHDCDVAFRRLPDFDRMVAEHPRACLLSDTLDYIGFEHLRGLCRKIREEKPDLREDDLIHRMCETVGIDFDVVRRNEKGSGGAQYLLRNVGRRYWSKVYEDSSAIRRLFDRYVKEHGLAKEPKDYIQVWTAGMWAYLWNLWHEDQETVVHSEMKFLFSGAPSKQPGTIMHMAGLPEKLKPMHYDKEDWWKHDPTRVVARQPYLFDHLPERTISREYVAWIHQTAGVAPSGVQPLAPSNRWRLLVWKTDSKSGFWDVERVRFQFAPGVATVGSFASGHAGPGYESAHAFNDGPEHWGGRSDGRPDLAPCLYLGVELDQPAIPEKVSVTQAEGDHVARLAIVQFEVEDPGGKRWVTGHVGTLDPGLIDQTVLYRNPDGHAAAGWRIVAHATSTGFAWDVNRLRFLRDAREERGRALSSGFARPEEPSAYGHDLAFDEAGTYWGGRPDAAGHFILGIENSTGIEVNRITLDQGSDHWAARIEIQTLDADGNWIPFREVDNLGPGSNDILLFETEDRRAWKAPRVASKRAG